MVQFNEKIGPGGGVKKIGREDGGPKRFGGKRGGGTMNLVTKNYVIRMVQLSDKIGLGRS